ncbi:MAG: DsbA family protein [Candidatus Methanoperedens sp.]|nr:DsbA family protein [Candidatus Methanoperedens sp.]
MAKKKMRNSNRVSKSNNTKKAIIGIAVLTVIVLGYYYLNPQEGASNSLDVKKIEGKYTQLSRNPTPYQGKVVVTEFMSFYCDHCYGLENRMPAILEKYGERLQVVYKPIVWGGQSTNSVEAYIIAEQLGKEKEIREALFKAQFKEGKDISDINELKRIAASIGLGEEFNSKLEKGEARKQAQANIQLSQTYFVDETPSIIVNNILKVTPHNTEDNIDLMAQNLDTIIGSIIKQS